MSAPAPTTDTVTALRTLHPELLATKTVSRVYDYAAGRDRIEISGYSRAAHFALAEYQVGDIAAAARLLDKLSCDQRVFWIRGAPLPGIDRRRVRRRKLAHADAAASFAEAPRFLIPIDVDHAPLPALSDPVIDPMAIVEHIVGLLPAELHDATCWATFTTSAGLPKKPGAPDEISLRLVFWGDRQYHDHELKRWALAHNAAAGRKLIDPAIYQPVQPIYIARPKFVGMRDPLPQRTCLRLGLGDAVTLAIPKPPRPTPPIGSAAGPHPGQGAAGYLAKIGGPEGFRDPIRSAIASHIATWGAQAGFNTLKARIRQAIAAADPGGRDQATLDRYASDHHLDELIAAIRTAQGDKPGSMERAGITLAPPPFPLPSDDITATRAHVQAALTGFFARRFSERDPRELRSLPPRMLLNSATGSAKSQLILEMAVGFVGFDRDVRKRPHRVIVAAENHRLMAQLADRYRASAAERGLNVTVEVWHGRGNPFTAGFDDDRDDDPLLDTGRCRNPHPIGDGLHAGADLPSHICGAPKRQNPATKKKPKRQCPIRDDCEYWRMVERCANADIVILAYNFLFDPLPNPILHNINCVIIEEDPSNHAIGTVAIPSDSFSPTMARMHPVLFRGQPDTGKTAKLAALFKPLDKMVEALSDGYTVPDAIAASGIDPVALIGEPGKEEDTALTLNCKRKVPDRIYPGMPRRARKARVAACRYNTQLTKINSVICTVAEVAAAAPDPALDKRMYLAPDKNGQVLLVVPGLLHLARWAEDLPILIASATARFELLTKIFPGLKQVAVPCPAAPHQRVHHILGSFGKNGGLPAKLPDLVDFVRLHTHSGKKALVVTNAIHEHAFVDQPGVDTLHYGMANGDDSFRQHDIEFIFGGPFADDHDTARRASAEHQTLIHRQSPQRIPAVGLLSSGDGYQFERMGYTDPRLMAAHQDVYDTAVAQAIGRARGSNRSAANPVETFVCTNVPLRGIAVDTVARYRKPHWLDRMWLRGHVPTNAHDAARLYPDLFPSYDAARKAYERLREAHPGEPDPIGTRTTARAAERGEPTTTILWQPAGKGQKARISLARSDQVSAVRAALEAAFPAGLIMWKPSPQTPQTAEEDRDNPRNKDLFLALSRSSAEARKLRRTTGRRHPPRAPPPQLRLL